MIIHIYKWRQQAVYQTFMKINDVGGDPPLSIYFAHSKWQVQALMHE